MLEGETEPLSGLTPGTAGPQSPLQRYRRDLSLGRIEEDPAQDRVMACLQEVYDRLMARRRKRPGPLGRMLAAWRKPPPPVEGLYLWGGVGRGKTYMMDLFYQCLPGERKMRMHFHRFMAMVHRQLQQHRGIRNPLERVAGSVAEQADIVCFDEFFVQDIGDAMLLGNLLDALFSRGVTLVATSNIEPERLYENGLQRQRFLPAIALIKAHTRVVNVDGGRDWRLRSLEKAEIYHSPLGPAAEARLLDCFHDLSAGLETEADTRMEVLGRFIPVRCLAEDLAWFDFGALCGGPRSAADYTEIARTFHTVLLSDVPVMDEACDDRARRFIALVDEFYDHGVKLIISAAAPPAGLYQGRELAFAFERTVSRLREMQTNDYLAREHAP